MTIPATALISWYRAHARDLPWRQPGTTAWGVLVSEVMSQQTPVARVAPRWQEWMRRWPTPADLAAAGADEVLRAWDRLGYPRRALRLRECAGRIVADHGGRVPRDVDTLRSLPGIGDYTAAAVASFHFGAPVPVVDTNVRRVYARAVTGQFLAGPARKADQAAVGAILPPGQEPEFSVALMELGALVCTARTPSCARCPLHGSCAWVAAGSPEPSAEQRARAAARVQRYVGTDRQVRGRIMGVLRAAHAPVPARAIAATWDDDAQRERALESLLADGLAQRTAGGCYQLPG